MNLKSEVYIITVTVGSMVFFLLAFIQLTHKAQITNKFLDQYAFGTITTMPNAGAVLINENVELMMGEDV